MPVTLSDGQVTLRPWANEDAEFLTAASGDPSIRRYNGGHDRLGYPDPVPSRLQAESVIKRFGETWQIFDSTGKPCGGLAFAVTDAGSGAVIGCCGVDDWTDEDVAQFGYWIAPEARDRGNATRASVLLTRWLFALGAARVFLTIVAGNDASCAVARRAGFVHEGTMRAHSVWQGERCDVMVFAALPSEWRMRDPAGDGAANSD